MIAQKRQEIINLMKQYFSMKDFQRTFSLLKPFVMKHWQAYLVLLFLLVADIVLTIGFAWFFGNVTDAAIKGSVAKILSLAPFGVFLILLSISSTFLTIFFETAAVNGVKRDLKNHLFDHVMRLPASDASNLRSGDLLSHFTNDIHSIDGVIGSSLIDLIRLPVVYTAVFIYLYTINSTLSFLSLMIAPLAAIGGVIFGLLLRRNSRLIHSLYASINSHLSEAFHGFSVVRSFTLEKLMFKKYARKNQELYQLEMENAKLQGWFYSGGQLVSSITFYFSLSAGAYFVSKGNMTVGALITFVNLVNYLVYPLTGLAGQWAGFQRSVTAVERMVELLEKPADSIELPSYAPAKSLLKTIYFQNITFSYDETKKIFHHFHLQIPAGKVVAIVGPSGAGKSTLFNLLQGFYRPQSGSILIDGISTEELTLSELRSAIAHVPQETFLFGGTIRENLLLARPGITEDEMMQAAVHAHIHDFILSLPDGYNTEIGERGIKLSVGQKQRVAIARAILKDAPILLLDEATSALDSETEFYVKEALDKLMKDRTTLVIAHRLSTVQNADFIVVLDNGSIVQTGTHEELIKQTGLYRNLHKPPVQQKKPALLSIVSK